MNDIDLAIWPWTQTLIWNLYYLHQRIDLAELVLIWNPRCPRSKVKYSFYVMAAILDLWCHNIYDFITSKWCQNQYPRGQQTRTIVFLHDYRCSSLKVNYSRWSQLASRITYSGRTDQGHWWLNHFKKVWKKEVKSIVKPSEPENDHRVWRWRRIITRENGHANRRIIVQCYHYRCRGLS